MKIGELAPYRRQHPFASILRTARIAYAGSQRERVPGVFDSRRRTGAYHPVIFESGIVHRADRRFPALRLEK